ncbi:hypothetical protein BTA51_28280 [Hahella sp. CCB-MM4]|uniref:hypothetical protein n=1 Tax=Hahella sp. (strain CCB-MM4) TaxID=1926491 RepID=UPI000B9B047A|nr:hypothetical protein [Hahella sp. CCB-MM4]OZG70028.1 hypothetical protein BTA51_28280 [Hahella sp. CCB-MM4]
MIKGIFFAVSLILITTSFSTHAELFPFEDGTTATFAAGVLSDEGKYAVAWYNGSVGGWIVDNLGREYSPIQANASIVGIEPSQILALADGQFLIVHNKLNDDGSGGYGQLYNADGTLLGQTVYLTPKVDEEPTITGDVWSASLADGNVVVAWTEHVLSPDDGHAGYSNVYAQIYSPSLLRIGNVIEVSTDHSGRGWGKIKNDVRVAAFDSGDFVVTFQAKKKFYGRRFIHSGYPKTDREFTIGNHAQADLESRILALSNSRYVFAWSEGGGHRPLKSYLQVLNGSDQRLGNPVVLNHKGRTAVETGSTAVEIESLTKRSTRHFWVTYSYQKPGRYAYKLATQPYRLEMDDTLTSLLNHEGMELADNVSGYYDDTENNIPRRKGLLLNYRSNLYVSIYNGTVDISDHDWFEGLLGEQFGSGGCHDLVESWTELCPVAAPTFKE